MITVRTQKQKFGMSL